jgi:PAS domain S-box-containing protein
MDIVEAYFLALVEHAPIAICISRNGVILYANPACRKMFGFARLDEIVGKPTAALWLPEFRALVYECAHQRSKGLSFPTEYEATALCKEGSQFPAKVAVTKVELPDGQATAEFITDLTELQWAEEALRQRNRYIETIFEEAPIGFAVHTVDDGVARFVSARFEEIYGVPRGAIDSHYTFFDKVWPYDPDLREQVRSRVVADMSSGDASRMHWENVPVQTADGKTRYINAMNIPVLDQNLMVSTVQDVTERIRAEVELKDAHRRLAATMAAIPDLMFEADVKGRIYAFHAPATGALYAQPEAFLGKLVEDVIPTDAAGVILKALTQAATEGSHRGATYALDMPGGRRWFELSIATKAGGSAPDARFVAIVREITERKQAEETLEKNRRLLAEMENIGKVGGWEIDLDTMKLTWTPEVYAIHEVDLTYEPTVEKAIQFYSTASRPVIERLVQRAIEHGDPYDLELEIITAKGNLRNVYGIGRTDLEHHRIYGFFQDITAQKQSEREMAQLRLELTHATRVLTLNEISGSLAHEINQPLAAILNNAGAARTLLSQAQDKREEIPEIIEDIIQDANRAAEIVRKLRGLVKKGDEPFGVLSINSLINDVLAFLNSTLAINKVTIRLDLRPDLPNISGDRVRLQQVLLNLVTNAVDAMKETPSRILRVRSAMDAQDIITVSVCDSGSGIPEAQRGLVFQPFFTTKKHGLGLGLPICQSIIKEHGGRIWEENNPGCGATFSFSLNA